MHMRCLAPGTTLMLCCLAATAAYCGDEDKADDSWRYANSARGAASVGMISEQKLAKVVPGMSTKSQVQRLLGTPWRVVQFNDCGAAMPGQADETWDYRGRDSAGATYRVHIEFDDHNVADLVAKIPDTVPDGKGTPARTTPGESAKGMTMSAKSMPM